MLRVLDLGVCGHEFLLLSLSAIDFKAPQRFSTVGYAFGSGARSRSCIDAGSVSLDLWTADTLLERFSFMCCMASAVNLSGGEDFRETLGDPESASCEGGFFGIWKP